MRDAIFHLKRSDTISLQAQIRELLVNAILGGQLVDGEPLPSSRRMAENMGVSRNTVVLAYQDLVDDGYLIARERSGYYVNGALVGDKTDSSNDAAGKLNDAADNPRAPDWPGRFSSAAIEAGEHRQSHRLAVVSVSICLRPSGSAIVSAGSLA